MSTLVVSGREITEDFYFPVFYLFYLPVLLQWSFTSFIIKDNRALKFL